MKDKQKVTKDELNYIFTSLTRFAYLIELTTSVLPLQKWKLDGTKEKLLKLEKVALKILGNFNQKKTWSNSFEECTNIFTECITLLSNSDDHINIMILG